MRLRTRLLALAAIPALALSAALASTGAASAAPALPGSFAYNDGVFGPVTCQETHHDTNNLPGSVKYPNATTKGGWDEVQCTITNGTTLPDNPAESWFSDFRYEVNGHAGVTLPPGTDVNLGLIQVNVNGDGSGYHGIAWYPNG